MPAVKSRVSGNTSKRSTRATYRVNQPVIGEDKIDKIIAQRQRDRHNKAKREFVKSIGEVPLLLTFMFFSMIAGAFSSLWIGHELDISLRTGVHLPPFLFLGRDFVIGLFSSSMAIGTFLLLVIFLMAYQYVTKIRLEDEEKK